VLEAAQRFTSQPSEAVMRAHSSAHHVAPLFV